MGTTKKIPTLGAVASTEADEKKKAKGATMLTRALALLGLSVDAKPAGKMSKRTETTKHTVVHESDTDPGKEEEEEEEEMDSATDQSEPGTEDSEASSAAEEEEEEEASAEEEEEERGTKGKKGAKYEEEEAKALSRAVSAALKSSRVKAAFLAEIPEQLRPLAALRSPDRIFREMRRATGAKTVDGAMTALSRLRVKAAGADEKVLARQATLEAKVAKIETDSRKDRVEQIVKQAKAEARAGATTKEGRAMLREYGMEHGSKKLEAFIAAQPKVVRTMEKGALVPRAGTEGEVLGGMGGAEDKILAEMTAGMTPEAKAAFEADYKKRLNGAAAARAPRS